MNPLWSPALQGLTPYVPGEQPLVEGLIKLNTNECPYPPSDAVLAAIRNELDDSLRLYPDPQSLALRRSIAANHGLQPEQVFVGNGSDEVLAHVFVALLRHGLPVLSPDIGYSFYPVYARLYGVELQAVPLAEDFSIRVDDYLKAGRNGGILIANPNAPTGLELPRTQLRRLLEGNRESPVIVDEAYVDFGAETAADWVNEFPQLLVVRTLSKSRALAGLRVGYALGQAGLIDGLIRAKDSFNSYPLGRLSQAGAQAAMEDVDWFERTRTRIMATRDRLSVALAQRGGHVLNSRANFVFVSFAGRDGAGLTDALRQRRILVRHFSNPERIAPFLRISVGTDAQIDALIAALDEIFANGLDLES